MQDAWTVWRDSLLFKSSEQAHAPSSAESSLETSPENGPASDELRTVQRLSTPVEPDLLSRHLDTVLSYNSGSDPNAQLASLFSAASAASHAPGFPSLPAQTTHTSGFSENALQSFLAQHQHQHEQAPQQQGPVFDNSKQLTVSSGVATAAMPASDEPEVPVVPALSPVSTQPATTTTTSKRRSSTSQAVTASSTGPDRRARNTEASARFRKNKKAREEEAKRHLEEVEASNAELKHRVTSLERENQLLRSLIVGTPKSDE